MPIKIKIAVAAVILSGVLAATVKAYGVPQTVGSVGWACQGFVCFAYRTDSGKIIAIRKSGGIEIGFEP